MQRGQRRLDDVAEVDVVEANYREIFRDREPMSSNRAQRTDRREIIRGHDCSWRKIELKEFLHAGLAAIDAVVAGANVLRMHRQSVPTHCLAEGGDAVVGDCET